MQKLRTPAAGNVVPGRRAPNAALPAHFSYWEVAKDLVASSLFCEALKVSIKPKATNASQKLFRHENLTSHRFPCWGDLGRRRIFDRGPASQ